jgi:hypothetical protein
MDPATLYTIIVLSTGEHRTNTREFATLAQCNAAAKALREQERLNSKKQIYCLAHKPRRP